VTRASISRTVIGARPIASITPLAYLKPYIFLGKGLDEDFAGACERLAVQADDVDGTVVIPGFDEDIAEPDQAGPGQKTDGGLASRRVEGEKAPAVIPIRSGPCCW